VRRASTAPPAPACYVAVARPRKAWVQAGSLPAARYLVRMSAQALNHGMPALRPGGRALAALGRRTLPVEGPARALLRLPARPVPELDLVLDRVRDDWSTLTEASDRLPVRCPELSLLAVERLAGRFCFVFGDDDPSPLLVLKPAGDPGVVDPELTALHAVAGLGLAPRVLPALPGLAVQEGLPGGPLRVLAPGPPGWTTPYVAAYDQLGPALVRLALTTRAAGRPPGVAHVEVALPHTRGATRHRLAAVQEELAGHDGVVLEHHDLSAQNWLVDHDRLTGLVDWEAAVPDGMPGYDAVHSAVALLEHGVALRSWGQAQVLAEFTRAWHEEPLFASARAWHRACVTAVTGTPGSADALLVAYFASRLARRLHRGGPALLDVATVTAMLDVVAGTPADVG